jgi:hypothetical protein
MMIEFRESKTNFETLFAELKNVRNLAQNLDIKLNPIKVIKKCLSKILMFYIFIFKSCHLFC